MKLIKRLSIVHLLNAIVFSSFLLAQPVTMNTAAPPPPNATVGPIGTPGFTPYYYIVIANYPAGSAASQIIPALNGNATLNSTNYNQVGWQLLAGALTYDVLRLTSPTYTGSCTCSVTTGLGPTITGYADQGGSLSSYTQASGAQGVQTQIYVNNRDYAFPKMRVQLQSGATLTSHLAEVPSTAALPAYCLIGDVDVVTGTQTLWGCGPTANNWYLIGGGSGSGQVLSVFTAGTGGTTANQPVKLSAATVVKLLTTDTAPDVAIGIAQQTVIAGAQVVVAVGGVSNCVADTGGIAAGNLVGVGTTVADTCIDLGQSLTINVPPNTVILGRALTTALATATSNVYLFPQTGANTGTKVNDCGTAAGACSVTSIGANAKIVYGTATATSASPSTVAITGMPAFTSTTSFRCFAQNATTAANVFSVLTAGYVSTSAVTFTGPNTLTDVIRWMCIGS